MKVLLINTPTIYAAVTTSDWDTTAEDIGAFPPIGLSYLAGYLQEHSNHEVEILDSLAERLDYDEIEKRIIMAKPDLVGVTAFTATFYDTLMTVRLAKKHFPNCKVIVGGSHVTTHGEDTLHHKEIDFVVRGEGEKILCDIANTLESGDSVRQVEGVSYRDENGEFIHVGAPGYHKDVNELPLPAFDLLPLHLYKSAIGSGSIVGVIATSRGCPYECTFCNRPYRSYRSYTTERSIEEMQVLYDKGHREFMFFDDMFNIKPKRVIDYALAIKERFTERKDMDDVTWSFRGRVEQVTAEMAKLAYESGCRQILFGTDGGSDEDFIEVKKKITEKEVQKAVAICQKAGIETSINLIIGLPTHRSTNDIDNLLDFTIKTGTDFAQFNILIPYSDAPLYPVGVEKGILEQDFWSEYVKNPAPHAYIPIWDEYLTRDELSALLKKCYRKFYLRPSKVIKNLCKLRSLDELQIKLKGLKTILGYGGFSRNEAT